MPPKQDSDYRLRMFGAIAQAKLDRTQIGDLEAHHARYAASPADLATRMAGDPKVTRAAGAERVHIDRATMYGTAELLAQAERTNTLLEGILDVLRQQTADQAIHHPTRC